MTVNQLISSLQPYVRLSRAHDLSLCAINMHRLLYYKHTKSIQIQKSVAFRNFSLIKKNPDNRNIRKNYAELCNIRDAIKTLRYKIFNRKNDEVNLAEK